VLGNSTYPRPCSGFTGFEQQKCFCHYHPTGGTYVWPFSNAAMKCREAIHCKDPDPYLYSCPETAVADDVEYNGNTRCLPEPANFNCSTGGKKPKLLATLMSIVQVHIIVSMHSCSHVTLTAVVSNFVHLKTRGNVWNNVLPCSSGCLLPSTNHQLKFKHPAEVLSYLHWLGTVYASVMA
jgi:hypothetical protein